MELDAWQREALRSRAQRLLMNCCRQSGKSTLSALIAVHQAAYHPGSLVLLISPSLRQSGELFRKCLDSYRALVDYVPPEAESALRLELQNGSRIISLPGRDDSTVRGYSAVSLLVIDEAAFVADELFHAIAPMLAVSRGRLLALSTPNGQLGWWYEAWRAGEDWERYKVTAEECPRIPREFLAEQKRTMPRWRYETEFECRFSDTNQNVFSSADVEAAFVDGPAYTLEDYFR